MSVRIIGILLYTAEFKNEWSCIVSPPQTFMRHCKDSIILIRNVDFEAINIRIVVYLGYDSVQSGKVDTNFQTDAAIGSPLALTRALHTGHLYNRIVSRSVAAVRSAADRAVINLSHIVFAY